MVPLAPERILEAEALNPIIAKSPFRALEGRRRMCKANKKLFEKMPLVSNLPVNIIEFNNFSREMSRQL